MIRKSFTFLHFYKNFVTIQDSVLHNYRNMHIHCSSCSAALVCLGIAYRLQRIANGYVVYKM